MTTVCDRIRAANEASKESSDQHLQNQESSQFLTNLDDLLTTKDVVFCRKPYGTVKDLSLVFFKSEEDLLKCKKVLDDKKQCPSVKTTVFNRRYAGKNLLIIYCIPKTNPSYLENEIIAALEKCGLLKIKLVNSTGDEKRDWFFKDVNNLMHP